MSDQEKSNLDISEKKQIVIEGDDNPQEKEDLERKLRDDNLVMMRSAKFYIILYIFFTAFFVFYTFIMEVIFLQLLPGITSTSIDPKNILGSTGYFLLFVFPLIHLFFDGMKIIALHETIFLKLYTLLIVLIEIVIMVPMPFFHTKTVYSIYLFNERGIELMLSPQIIFFPTSFITSNKEIIRNILTSLFFIILIIVIMLKNLHLNPLLNLPFLIIELVSLSVNVSYVIKKIMKYFKQKKLERKEKKQQNKIEKEMKKKEKKLI